MESGTVSLAVCDRIEGDILDALVRKDLPSSFGSRSGHLVSLIAPTSQCGS